MIDLDWLAENRDAVLHALHARYEVCGGPGGVEDRLAVGRRTIALGASTQRPEALIWGHVWRIEDAYDDLKDLPKTGEILPYNNFPMEVKEGQVFVIEYLRTDGTTYRTTYRSDGRTVGGLPSTEAVTAEPS